MHTGSTRLVMIIYERECISEALRQRVATPQAEQPIFLILILNNDYYVPGTALTLYLG